MTREHNHKNISNTQSNKWNKQMNYDLPGFGFNPRQIKYTHVKYFKFWVGADGFGLFSCKSSLGWCRCLRVGANGFSLMVVDGFWGYNKNMVKEILGVFFPLWWCSCVKRIWWDGFSRPWVLLNYGSSHISRMMQYHCKVLSAISSLPIHRSCDLWCSAISVWFRPW